MTDKPQEIPWNAPAIPHHYLYGEATRTFQYGYAFVVAHFGEQVEELTWREGRWTFKPYGAGRPLYRAERLIKRPEAPVLVVASEDCVKTAERLLPSYVSVTWAGGAAQMMDGHDWSALKGRDVIVWPDAGLFPVELVQLILLIARRVRVLDSSQEPNGWNIVAAAQAGFKAPQLVTWANRHIVSGHHYHGPVIEAPPLCELLAPATWEELFKRPAKELGVELNRSGRPYGTVANLVRLVRAAARTLRFDEFTERVTFVLGDETKQWGARETFDLYVLLQERMPTISRTMIEDAVTHAAHRQSYHSLRDYLGSLIWDRVERLKHWLSDATGASRDAYTAAVGRNWLIAMVARAYDPACPAPFMLVLEGASAHERLMLATTLAAPWVAQLSWPLNEVQVTEQLRGAWLALVLPNLSELTAQQRARLHTQVTTYRSNRTALFLGGADPLPESTGFWAIACGRIDIEGLRAFRDQLFAEAVIAYRQGAALAPVPQRPGTERKRQEAQVDEWKDQVLEHCTRVYAEAQRTRVKNYLTTARILTDALGIQPYQQERAHHMRVAAILKGNGWVQRRDSACRYYRPIFRRT